MPIGPTITFRALARGDFPMLRRWLNTPHVHEWWGWQAGPGALGGAAANAATAGQVEAKYGPEADAGGPTHRFVIEINGRPIGLIQWYHLGDFADYARAIGEDVPGTAGIDFFVGEPDAIGRGIGTRAVEEFVATLVFKAKGVSRVVGGPAAANARSIRVFEKAGFRRVRSASVPGEPFPELIMARMKSH